MCRQRLSVAGRPMLWLQAEVLATDLAEFAGAAIGMQLLFGMPVAVPAVVSLALLELRRKGRTRPFELMSAAALMFVASGIGYDIIDTGGQSASGLAAGP
ncbi:divalent metal cation transporter [Nonomuraea sp. NPDC046802]|uniref:divalent metal cation transporter n=1 Tax=Nonomuraea sp. NPDC046802 TaxID=3154919 RepID=UPI0033D34D89